jgi:tetratricopeptide (TPR) repeat protein
MHNVASVLEKQGRVEEACSLYSEVVRQAEEVLPEGHWNTAIFHGTFGNCLVELKRYEEAEEHLLRSYRDLEAAVGPDHRRTIDIRQKLAGLYDAWGKPQEAGKYRHSPKNADKPD